MYKSAFQHIMLGLAENLAEEDSTPPVFAHGLLQDARHLHRRLSGRNIYPALPSASYRDNEEGCITSEGAPQTLDTGNVDDDAATTLTKLWDAVFCHQEVAF